MSRVVTLRLSDEQYERLSRIGEKLEQKPSATAALLLEESMREEEFPDVEIRGTIAGREAFVRGSRLKIMHVVPYTWGDDGWSAAKIAEGLGFREEQIACALDYADRYADEIAAAIADGDAKFDALFPDARAARMTAVDASAP
jgi:uncharacterized protein (DUF433 family)